MSAALNPSDSPSARSFRQAFRRRLLLRLVLLILTVTVTIALISAYYTAFDFFAAAACALLICVIAGQAYGLLIMVERSHRTFEQFLDAVAHGDITQKFAGSAEHSPVLAQAINDVMEQLRSAYAEREAQATFLQALVKHVPVALLSLRAGGELAMTNNAARRLLDRTLPEGSQDRTSWLAGIDDIAPGNERMLRIRAGDQILDLKVSATEIRLRGDVQKLFAIENMTSELEARELAAWRNLIRVLTHEIMNSVTPITSLARTVEGVAESLEQSDLGPEEAAELQDIKAAVATIGRRGQGLLEFLENYRSMTRVPEPVLKRFQVRDLYAGLEQLLAADYAAAGVGLVIDVTPASLTLEGDVRLLEQALINLLTNAKEAVAETADGEVRLVARLTAGHVALEVNDNGPGMSQETMDQVFIPFYTTKRGGSGIGLTLCKQIVRAHGGQILVESEPGEGTSVRLII